MVPERATSSSSTRPAAKARCAGSSHAATSQSRGDDDEVGSEWEGYLSGAYGVCLKHVTPENIARKSALVAEIEGLLAAPQPEDARLASETSARASTSSTGSSARSLRDYDRARWGPSSRDRCITASRELYPEVFSAAALRD